MPFDDKYEGDVPPEFLLNPKMMAEYINMMTANVEFLESEIERITTIRAETQAKLDEITSKREILGNFLKFSEAKGFAHTKQQTEQLMKETTLANTDRIKASTEDLHEFDICYKEFPMGPGVTGRCMKSQNHIGPCSIFN